METWDLLADKTFAVILSKVGGSLLMCRKFNSLFLKCKLGRIYSIVDKFEIVICILMGLKIRTFVENIHLLNR